MGWQEAVPDALLHDEDPAIVDRVTEQLGDLGYAPAVVLDDLPFLPPPNWSGPDLVLVGLEEPLTTRIAFARNAKVRFPRALVLGYTVDFTADILAEAMAVGIRRVLPYPFSTAMLRQTIEAMRVEMQTITARTATSPPHPPSIERTRPQVPAVVLPEIPHQLVALSSPKGGVGTSTLAVNLAVALQALGYATVLVDLNLNFASHNVFLDIQSNKSLADLVDDDVITHETLTSVLVRHSSGLHALLGPEQPEDGERILFEHIQQALSVLRDDFVFTIVDACPCFDGRVLAALEMSNTILVPVCPDLPTMKNANSYLRVIELLHYDMNKLLLVMIRADSVSQHEMRDIESALNREIQLRIVSDGLRTTSAANTGAPFVLASPEVPISQNVFTVARALVSRASENVDAPKPKKQSMVDRFLRR